MNVIGRITGNDDVGYAVTVTNLETGQVIRDRANYYQAARTKRDLIMDQMCTAVIAAGRVIEDASKSWTCICGAVLPADTTIEDHMDYCTG